MKMSMRLCDAWTAIAEGGLLFVPSQSWKANYAADSQLKLHEIVDKS